MAISPLPIGHQLSAPQTGPLIRRLRNAYIEFHARGPFKLPAVGLLGAIAFPFYYLVWTYVFPQPYENLNLRLAGTGLCMALAWRDYWPRRLRPYYLPFAYVALLYSLPGFFTFMMLMNDANTVWIMSTMAAVLFIMLLYDVKNAILVSVAGTVAGIAAFWAITGRVVLPPGYLAALPIYGFTIAAVLFLSHSEQVISREKLLAAYALASTVAHEMRTPLLGIRLDAERARELIEQLAAADRAATERGHAKILDGEALKRLLSALGRIEDHSKASNQVIDMLLMNLRAEHLSRDGFKALSMASAVNTAIARYHFRPGEREKLVVQIEGDFRYSGSEDLMIHVIYNLLKNALRAIHEAGAGRVEVQVLSAGRTHILRVRDTGIGIDRASQAYIFLPFMSTNTDSGGTGIGLAFCRWVIEGFGGTIWCTSEPGKGTEFTIALPQVDADGPAIFGGKRSRPRDREPEQGVI